LIKLARSVFDKMPMRDLISWNLFECGRGEIKLVRKVFDKMPQRGNIFCNVMIDEYVKNGKFGLVVDVFMAMNVRDVVT
jgi:pentatricopeptide repeat protein